MAFRLWERMFGRTVATTDLKVQAPLTEPIAKPPEPVPAPTFEPTPEMKKFVSEYVDSKFSNISVTLIWGASSVEIRDHENETVARIKWKDGVEAPEVSFSPTPAFVRGNNVRVGYSCAMGERRGNDGSMTGKMASARSEVGGVCSTN